ncbi:MAG: phosphatidate cytidylyltransferase [Candidatus Aminicenantes bacterium]|nr:phosphatidate cytidylyltransferase [Candidatus Aminicenantes bacterium]
MSLRARTSTALVLIVLVVTVIQWAPGPVFFLFLQAVVLAALMEFYNLARRRGQAPVRILGALLALLIGLPALVPDIPFPMALFAGFLVAAVYFVAATTTVEKLPAFSPAVSLTVFGALYVAFPLDFFYVLREEQGPFTIYFLFAVIFLGDTGAFLIGKAIGRHKMTPLASPNKTWEGSAGGILLAALGAIAARAVFLPELDLGTALVTGVLVHAAAQVSDPLESLFKRAVGVKDSSNVLPGHGGFLDRVDSFLLAAPLFYYIVRYLW